MLESVRGVDLPAAEPAGPRHVDHEGRAEQVHREEVLEGGAELAWIEAEPERVEWQVMLLVGGLFEPQQGVQKPEPM